MTAAAPHYVVQRLTTFNWLAHIWPRLRRDRRNSTGGAIPFYYIDATRLGERLATAMCRRAGLQLKQLQFDAAHIFDDGGLLVWLRTYYRDLNDVLHRIAADASFPASATGSRETRNRLMYLRKSSVVVPPIFEGPGAWRGIFLIHVCLWHAARAGSPSKAVTLWLENHPWFRALQRYGAVAGPISLVPCGRAFRPARFIRALLARDLKMFASRFRVSRLSSDGERETRSHNEPTIALQYYGQFNLSSPNLHSDFFFWQQSELEGRHIVGLFSSPQDPLDARRVEELTSHGMRGVALHHTATKLPATVFASPSVVRAFGRAAQVAALAFAKPQRAWTSAQNLLFESEVSYWLRLMEHCNAKIFLTWYKYTADHSAVAEAMRRRDGVIAVYQRSYEGNPSAQTAVSADLAFGFSAQGAAVERASGSHLDYYVVTGYLGDHRFPLVKSAAGAIRAGLKSHGATFVIAFFDEGSFPDPRWGPGSERTRSNYSSILERVLSDPTVGVVFKPKTPRTLIARLGPVAELLERALRTGRCHILDEGLVHGSVPPAQAALASDIAIHESIVAATAAIEAALAGVPTLIMDPDGWTISPLYRLGSGSVIFQNWDDLWEAIDRIRANRSASVGDWTPLLDEIDPFHDGRAAERMGTFLKWVIECYERGGTRDHALAEAAERYSNIWGADKVLSVAPEPA